MLSIPNYINGEHQPPRAGRYLDNVEPATGQVYSWVANSDAADVADAAEAARRAFPAWAATPAAERSRILLDVARRIDDNLDRLARAEAIDNGKPLKLARLVDIPRAAP